MSAAVTTTDRDPGRMLDRIRDLPTQVTDAWALARAADLPRDLSGVRDITVSGMGGSAIGGDLAAALLADRLRVPMSVHRDYGLPAYVGKGSLVIASSYSGNTEETLSGFAEARKRGAKVLAITTGGKLAEEVASAKLPVLRFSYDAKPRAVLGWSLTLVLGALSKVGLVDDLSGQVAEAVRELRAYATPTLERDAEVLARSFQGRVGGMYGAGVMGVMARRWKGQWNENAKNWSFFDVMPELNHNAVVGFPHPPEAREALTIVLLRSATDNPRVSLRFDVTKELLGRANVPVQEFRFEGGSRLAETLKATYLGDLISYHLTLLNGEDPSPNTSIDYLKSRLAAGR